MVGNAADCEAPCSNNDAANCIAFVLIPVTGATGSYECKFLSPTSQTVMKQPNFPQKIGEDEHSIVYISQEKDL
jgi:hypothetical protein